MEILYVWITSELWGYIFNFFLWITIVAIIIRSYSIDNFLYKKLFCGNKENQLGSKIAVLIPARDEPEIIKSIKSVLNQTYLPSHIVIVFNNCSDGGKIKREVQSFIKNNTINCTLLEMEENLHYKSGALNHGMEWIEKNLDLDYICQMDSDSELETHFLERTCTGLNSDEKIGALSSSFEGKKELFEQKNFFYYLQNIEYVKYHQCQLKKQVSVISGTGNLIRMRALLAVKEKFGYFWDNNSLVEDYSLTLNLKNLNYKVFKSRSYIVYTDLMPDMKSLWKQRVRWQRGTFEELFKRRVCKNTYMDYLKEVRFLFFSIFEYFVYILLILGIIYYQLGSINLIFIISPIFSLIMYNSYFTRKISVIQKIVCLLTIPLLLYGIFRFFWWMYSLLTFKNRQWEK